MVCVSDAVAVRVLGWLNLAAFWIFRRRAYRFRQMPSLQVIQIGDRMSSLDPIPVSYSKDGDDYVVFVSGRMAEPLWLTDLRAADGVVAGRPVDASLMVRQLSVDCPPTQGKWGLQ